LSRCFGLSGQPANENDLPDLYAAEDEMLLTGLAA
jgi:hypothetical protein